MADTLAKKAPDDPDVAFQAGIVAMNLGNWPAAAANLRKANIPAGEQKMVDTFLRLADINAGRLDILALQTVLAACGDDIRSLVLVSRYAQRNTLRFLPLLPGMSGASSRPTPGRSGGTFRLVRRPGP